MSSDINKNNHQKQKLDVQKEDNNKVISMMDRAYEDDKTLALVKDRGFSTVVPLRCCLHKKYKKEEQTIR